MLVELGFPEEQVWEMPMDKYNMYVASAVRIEKRRRASYVSDTMAAIGGALGGKGAGEYLEKLAE